MVVQAKENLFYFYSLHVVTYQEYYANRLWIFAFAICSV